MRRTLLLVTTLLGGGVVGCGSGGPFDFSTPDEGARGECMCAVCLNRPFCMNPDTGEFRTDLATCTDPGFQTAVEAWPLDSRPPLSSSEGFRRRLLGLEVQPVFCLQPDPNKAFPGPEDTPSCPSDPMARATEGNLDPCVDLLDCEKPAECFMPGEPRPDPRECHDVHAAAGGDLSVCATEDGAADPLAPTREKLFFACKQSTPATVPSAHPARFCFLNCGGGLPDGRGPLEANCSTDAFDPPEIAWSAFDVFFRAPSHAEVTVVVHRPILPDIVRHGSVGVGGMLALQPFGCSPGVSCGASITFLGLSATGALNLGDDSFLDIQMYNADPIDDEITPDPADPTRVSDIQLPPGARVYVSGLHDGDSDREGTVATVPSAMLGSIDWQARTFTLSFSIDDGAGSSISLDLAGDLPNLGPVANAGPDQTAECNTAGGARIDLSGAGSSDPDGLGDLASFSWSARTRATGTHYVGSGEQISPLAGLGDTHFALSLTDRSGVIGVDGVDVHVVDTTGPAFQDVQLSTGCLWPPDHEMRLLRLGQEIRATATDVCDGTTSTVRIVDAHSDQPADDTGDGSTVPDVRFGSAAVCLRAERQGGSGNGRTYTAILEAVDSHGNTTRYPIHVSVPHDQRAATRCRTGDLAPIVADDDPRCEANIVTPTSAATAVLSSAAPGLPPPASGGCTVSSTTPDDGRAPLTLLVLGLLVGVAWWRRR